MKRKDILVLTKVADLLDNCGKFSLANQLDEIITKYALSYPEIIKSKLMGNICTYLKAVEKGFMKAQEGNSDSGYWKDCVQTITNYWPKEIMQYGENDPGLMSILQKVKKVGPLFRDWVDSHGDNQEQVKPALTGLLEELKKQGATSNWC